MTTACSICLANNVSEPEGPTIRTRSSKPTRDWETCWTEKCADSVCKLLDLETETFKDFFVSEQKCSGCKELLYDIDYTSRCADALNNRLYHLKLTVAKLLYKTIQAWTTDSSTLPPSSPPLTEERRESTATLSLGDPEIVSDIKIEVESCTLRDDEETDTCSETGSMLGSPPRETNTSILATLLRAGRNISNLSSSTRTEELGSNRAKRSSPRVRKIVSYCENVEDDLPARNKTLTNKGDNVNNLNTTSPVNPNRRTKKKANLTELGSNTDEESKGSDTETASDFNINISESDSISSSESVECEDEFQNLANQKRHMGVRSRSTTQSKRSIGRRTQVSSRRQPRTTAKSIDKELLATVKFLTGLEKEENLKYYTYVCPIDGERFIDAVNLTRHCFIVHSQVVQIRQFQCPFCKTSAEFGYQLDAHIIRKHQGESRPFICPVIFCPMNFIYPDHLRAHLIKHHPEIDANTEFPQTSNSYQVTYRDKSLVGTAEAHLAAKRTFTADGKRHCYCPVEQCGTRCASQANLDIHYNAVHVQDPFPFKCPQPDCTKAFKGRNALVSHLALTHEVTEERTLQKCLFCPRQLLRRGAMNIHMRRCHRKLDVPKFYCKICNLLYFRQEECDEHEKLHTEEMRYKCVIYNCNAKEFASSEELKEHVDEHLCSTRSKKEICDICGRLVSDIKTHKRSHSAELLFKCNYCDKRFNSNSNRTSHQEIMHGTELEGKIYKCKICEATFTVKQYLYKHNAWHKYGANANLPVAKKKRIEAG